MMRIAASLVVAFGLVVSIAACGKETDGAGTGAAADPAVEAKRLIASGALVIDVREQDEWDEGHLSQAKHVPVATVGQQVAEIEQAAGGKDRPIVVYCKAGGRAATAKQALEAAGFTRVTNGGGYRKLAAP
jgi:phage shock protein E